MSHRDLGSGCSGLNSGCLKVVLRWLLQTVNWSSIQFRDDCTWTPRLLTTAALLWAWSDELTLVDRFQAMRRLCGHLFPQPQALAGSYQAFIKMLRRWTSELVGLLQSALRERGPQELAVHWQVLGFTMFGVDGSRAELPRTLSNERAYSAARKRRKSGRQLGCKKGNSPQLWLTTMWHVGSGLPWDWRIGPADSSERAHLLEMLPGLPPQALIAADAGFVGYAYAQAIVASGRQLLLRVGSNVKLLKKLGFARESKDTVYLWPDAQARHGQPPLVLRLVTAHNGKHPVYLLTSVLSARRLTDTQVVALYARRWGIELFYRHLKQTFQRRKLRSTSADNARMEMEWSLVALWAMALYALREIQAQGIPPRRLSIAQMLRAFRRLIRDYLHPRQRGRGLRQQLRSAIIDSYHRTSKSSREYPRKKQEQPPGPPRIIPASRVQQHQAQALRHNQQTKRLTA